MAQVTATRSGLQLKPKEYKDCSVETDEVTVRRPETGKNVVLEVNGTRHEIGRIASAFPISSALEAVAFFDTNGEEIGIMKHAYALDEESRNILREELEKAYFMPRIQRIISTRESLGVEEWVVVTDKGERSFEVRDARRNVRKISETRVIIKDVDGNRYEIPHWQELDRNSLAQLMNYI
jgi:hypothetical protein